MKKDITERQKQLLGIIYDYFQGSGYPPTFEEMREELKVASNQSVVDLLKKLVENGYIKRSEAAARGLTLLPLGYEALGRQPMAPFMGVAAGGPPIQALAITGEWQTLPGGLAKLKDEVFVLRISGDSMINAGIDDGDQVLVQTQKYFVSGDIVFAQVDDETTVKRFMSTDQPPYLFLKPENPKYQNILFKDNIELKGKVISVSKSGQWLPIK
ncbi:MAG: repressor LexA [Candidatus Magasanikbacteria bacterium]|nr:repressor LexA [Candidatus Magasanikbacteria bacterium]